jgi:hypothetical protein
VKPALALALVALMVAGCGGGSDGRLSKSDYEAKLRTTFHDAFDRVTTRDATMQNVAATYAGIASTLRGVHSPANVQSLNHELVDGAAKQAAALNRLSASLRGKPKAVRDRILAQFDAAGIAGRHEFDNAVATLRAKGYRISSSGDT